MKKNLMFAMFGAIALTGAVGITSCTSENDVAETNPNYNPETNEVYTQFVLNVSTSNQSDTRQSSAATQATSGDAFRGIQDAYLLPYTLTAHATNTHLYDVGTDEKATASRSYDFSSLLAANEITADNSRRVLEMSLPVGTNAILFYGRAKKDPSTYDAKVHGKIDYTIAKNARNTVFMLKSRLEDETACNQTFDLYQCILNHITRAGLHLETEGDNDAKTTRDLRYAFWWPIDTKSNAFKTRENNNPTGTPLYDNGYVGTADDEVSSGTTENHVGYTFYTGTKTWKNYGDDYAKNHDNIVDNDVEQKALEEILGSAYDIFTKFGPKELRAGYSEAILLTLQDLYEVTSKVENANPTNIPEHIAKLLGKEIRTRLDNFFSISGTTLAWKDLGALKTAVENTFYGKSVSSFSDVTGVITEFPTNLNMPLGSALLSFTPETQTWKYLSNIPNYDLGGTVQSYTQLDKYNYPAEIVYYGNSPLRVSSSTHATSDYPQTVTKWDTDDQWSADWTKNSAVASTTRSVAMQKDINYGSALLETTVGFASGVTKLYDNNKAFHPTEENNSIDAGSGNFQLTGILIAGLPKQVGWDFVIKADGDGKYKYDDMVYDDQIVDKTVPTTAGKPTYTLVWDTYNPSPAENQGQNSVFVALEFKNLSGKNFWGEANVVRKNGTFYVIGTLDPDNKTYPGRTYTNYNMPPFGSTGETIQTARVFMQDYVTKAHFVLGENSLKHAYVTVPDLRSSQLSLGLSVDITWETGLNFSNVVLGGVDSSTNP